MNLLIKSLVQALTFLKTRVRIIHSIHQIAEFTQFQNVAKTSQSIKLSSPLKTIVYVQ